VSTDSGSGKTAWARNLAAPIRSYLHAETGGAIVLVAATIAALIWANVSFSSYEDVWTGILSFSFSGHVLETDLRGWINEGLMTLFFLVVGLEAKRELDLGELRERTRLAIPVLASLGGMACAAGIYLAINAGGDGARGWGIPMATDIAMAVGVLSLLGSRVAPSLKLFLLALAIVDDIGAIVVVAVFYSGEIHPAYLAAAAVVVVALALLSRSRVYLLSPYILLGVALWAFVYAGGLHATLAGVVLALFIPTRPPADLAVLMTQASTIIASEARHEGEVLRPGPSTPALHALDAIYDRLESPADRLLRHAGARSSYAILPIFALANAGVTINPGVFVGHGWLMAAVVAGLAVGKPVGVSLAAAAAVRAGIAVKPAEYTWRQLAGAGALAGIGFTMSLFIAGQAFPSATDFSAAKIAVFAASILSAVVGTAVLWGASRQELIEEAPQSASMQIS
jgi:Na+:H+ antiporter, NhaA family